MQLVRTLPASDGQQLIRGGGGDSRSALYRVGDLRQARITKGIEGGEGGESMGGGFQDRLMRQNITGGSVISGQKTVK